jgi:hypothetical protein
VAALQGRRITTVEGLGTESSPNPLTACVHRGAGRAMRLLHRRNDHARTSPARANIYALGCADPGADGA